MNIKEQVLASLDDGTCAKYGINKHHIVSFFDAPVLGENKKDLAKNIIESLLYQHSKDDLMKAVNDLSDVESSVRDIGIASIKIRDHVVHALYTYCLGILLIERLQLAVSPFQWKLTSLLHDVGYPLDISMKLAKQTEKYSNLYHEELNILAASVVFGLRLTNFTRLTTGKSAVQLITARFRKWGFQFAAGKLLKEIERTGEVNHGVISGLFVLKLIERLYRKNNPEQISGRAHYIENMNWNYDTFYDDIVDIGSSVVIHSLPLGYFTHTPIDVDLHPLPFLLRFADELQDWDRVGRNNVFNNPEEYALDFLADRNVRIGLPREQLEHLQQKFQCFQGITLNFVEV